MMTQGAHAAQGAQGAPSTVRIEAGGNRDVTTGGVVWGADKYFEGGRVVDRSVQRAIDNTEMDRLYQTERYGLTGYSIPVNNGVYTVKLHFAETYRGTKRIGQRLFSVDVDGTKIENIDIFKEAGHNKAVVKTVQGISVNDTRLDIHFTRISGAPMINAIEVLPNGEDGGDGGGGGSSGGNGGGGSGGSSSGGGGIAVDGECGSAAGVPTPTKPQENLCAAGVKTEVTGTDPWKWQCIGSGGGSTASCSAPKNATTTGARGRVRIQNGTVVADNGAMLRGTSAGAIRVRPIRSSDPAFWTFMRTKAKLNLIRMGVKTKQVGRTVQQQLDYIDQAVDLAAKNRMYLLINNSIESGKYDLADLRAFWTVVAPRYKNQTHVIYELTNEATSGGPNWGCTNQYTDKVMSDLTGVWHLIRNAAPDTHIAWINTANLCPDEPAVSALLNKIKGVDWSNSSVSFHSYGGTYKFGEAGLAALKRKYPLIMTETNYWNPDVANKDRQRPILQWYERQKISWVSLDNQGNHLVNEIIPDLRAAGFTWEAQ